MPLWDLGPARPLFGVSGRLFGSTRSSSLVCPTAVRRVLGRSGARPAGSIRASLSTRECEAACASQLRYPRRQSPSAQKSSSSDTRAALPPVRGSRKRGSKARNAPALEPGEVSDLDAYVTIALINESAWIKRTRRHGKFPAREGSVNLDVQEPFEEITMTTTSLRRVVITGLSVLSGDFLVLLPYFVMFPGFVEGKQKSGW